MLQIYIDGDACPVKQEIYRVAARYGLPVFVAAASWMRIPSDGQVTLEVTGDDPDAADDWIAAHIGPDDIAITADIPLASRCLEKGAFVLGNTGKPFSDGNIGQALATREILSSLRDLGEATGGPRPFSKADRSRFLQQLDQAIQKIPRKHARD